MFPLQVTILIIAMAVTSLDFSFISLGAIEPNSMSAKVFYGVWIFATYLVYPGIYAVFAPCTMVTFGPKHYSANYGLVFTMNVSVFYFIFYVIEN